MGKASDKGLSLQINSNVNHQLIDSDLFKFEGNLEFSSDSLSDESPVNTEGLLIQTVKTEPGNGNQEKDISKIIKNKRGTTLDIQNSEVFCCDKCSFKSSKRIIYQNHQRQVHEKHFGCEQCNYKTGNKGNLANHIMAVHEKRKDFKCKECEYETGFKSTLNNHMQRYHKL